MLAIKSDADNLEFNDVSMPPLPDDSKKHPCRLQELL